MKKVILSAAIIFSAYAAANAQTSNQNPISADSSLKTSKSTSTIDNSGAGTSQTTPVYQDTTSVSSTKISSDHNVVKHKSESSSKVVNPDGTGSETKKTVKTKTVEK